MPKIAVNFDDVPDQILPIEPGVYTAMVESASVEATKDGKGEKVVVEMKIDDEANPNHGRKIFDHISTKMLTNLKRLAKSAGINVGADGLDIDDLVGKHVKLRTKTRVYKDPETGEAKESVAVAEYLF